jgi:hypothetical protein
LTKFDDELKIKLDKEQKDRLNFIDQFEKCYNEHKLTVKVEGENSIITCKICGRQCVIPSRTFEYYFPFGLEET